MSRLRAAPDGPFPPDNFTLIHADFEGDSLFVVSSPSGKWPPALHIGQADATDTRAVLMPTDPAELDAVLAKVRAAVLAAAKEAGR